MINFFESYSVNILFATLPASTTIILCPFPISISTPPPRHSPSIRIPVCDLCSPISLPCRYIHLVFLSKYLVLFEVMCVSDLLPHVLQYPPLTNRLNVTTKSKLLRETKLSSTGCGLLRPVHTINGFVPLQQDQVSTIFIRPHWHSAKFYTHYLWGMNNWLG